MTAPQPNDGKMYRCSCGANYFETKQTVRGIWTACLKSTEAGMVTDDTNLDRLRYGQSPKTMKCTECGKRHKTPADVR